MQRDHREQLSLSWQANADAWTAAVRERRIESRHLVTDAAQLGRFDLLVCNFALLEDPLAPTLSDLHGLLAAGGHLLIQTLHPWRACNAASYRDGWGWRVLSVSTRALLSPCPGSSAPWSPGWPFLLKPAGTCSGCRSLCTRKASSRCRC